MMKKSTKKLLTVLLTVLLVGVIFWPVFFTHYDTGKLVRAIEREDVATVRQMLEDGLDPNQLTEKPLWFWSAIEHSPRAPMAVACDVANLEIVELLIAYGATGAHIEGSSWSPLMTTLFHYEADDVKIVRLLLENGADSEYFESDVNPVFQAAWMRPRQSDREEEAGNGTAAGYDEDAARDITEIVKMLLGERSVNILDSSNRTLLMRAAQSENLYLVQYLLEAGCPTDAVNTYGKTALDYAKETGNPELIALLSES